MAADDDDCEHCNLDRVSWQDVMPCVYASFRGIWHDVCHEQKDDHLVTVLTRDDRILYVIGVVIFALTMQMVLAR